MKFNKLKRWTLHLGQGNPGCVYRLGNERVESSSTEKFLRRSRTRNIWSVQPEGRPHCSYSFLWGEQEEQALFSRLLWPETGLKEGAEAESEEV